MQITKLGWLIRYLEIKNEIMKKCGAETALTNSEDFEEICSWSQEQIHNVYARIREALLIRLNTNSPDSVFCPWCQDTFSEIHTAPCVECEYGSRHGTCGEEKDDGGADTYSHVLDEITHVTIRDCLREYNSDLEELLI